MLTAGTEYKVEHSNHRQVSSWCQP